MRRKRKKPSVEGLIFGILLLAFLGVKASGVTFQSILVVAFWSILVLIFIVVVIVFLKALYKSTKPKELKFQKSKGVKSNSAENSGSSIYTSVEELKWSEELIDKVEWRVFEKLCIGLWRAKGFDVEETGSGADGGVDFYLRARETNKRIGAVQCKSWKTKQVDVKTVRELQGVITSENLKLGLLMYSGVLSEAAKEFINKPTVSVKEQGASEIYKQVVLLTEQEQSNLLAEVVKEDYLTPSCPNCDIKMVERTAKRTGKKFLGCPNFPSCRYTIMHKK